MQIATKDLPAVLRSALKSLGFNRQDIAVKTAEDFSPLLSAGSGQRGFVCVVDLSTGETKTEKGSWGGSNPFEAKIVDRDDTRRALPANVAVILGYEGGGRPVSASITVHPQTVAPGLLAAPAVELTDTEKRALRVVRELISGYRAEEFSRQGLGKYDAANPLIAALVHLGLLKSTSSGAISITTAGKNALTTG